MSTNNFIKVKNYILK